MTIESLKVILAPPLNIAEPPPAGGWAILEARLGTALPGDYKEFVNIYGSGQIGEFLWIFNPFSANGSLNLEKQIALQAEVLEELATYGEKVPHKVSPRPGGILPFGITDNGDVLFWRVLADTDQWTVTVNEARSPEWEEFPLSMTAFLSEILSRNITCKIFPGRFPRAPVKYVAIP